MQMKKVIVLGAGLVGSVMAADLASDPELDVVIADNRADALEKARTLAAPHALKIVQADLGDTAVLKTTIEPFDMVVGALASVRLSKQERTLQIYVSCLKMQSSLTHSQRNTM